MMSDIITFNTETLSFTETSNHFKCSGYGLGEMIQKLSQPKVLEIGCDVGDTSQFLLDSNPECVLTCIDPYANYVDWNGKNINDRESVHQGFLNRLQKYGNRFNLIRDYSDNVAEKFSDEYFDVIFIDGLHTYEQVKKDCENFYSKVKTGGIFSGHDYGVIQGVAQAVDEFAKQIGKEIKFTECDVWYWIK